MNMSNMLGLTFNKIINGLIKMALKKRNRKLIL